MGIVSLYRNGKLKVWPDLLDRSYDDKAAPDLGEVVGGAGDPLYSDPAQFFARTYLTRQMEDLIGEVADTLKNRAGGLVFILTSLYGGGKTHTLITLHHAFSKPEALAKVNEGLAARVAEVKPLIVVIDGTRSSTAPNPREPCSIGGFTIKTIWGMLAYRLGAYARVMHVDDESSPPPSVDSLLSMLREANRPILILLDEFLYYIYAMDQSENLKGYARNLIIFIDWLARAVESSPQVALIISLQLERRGEEIIEEETFAGYAKRVYDVLHRKATRVITPVTPTDVVNILKKRIFQEIPDSEAGRARDTLYSIYREYPDLFGSESDWQCSPGEAGRIFTAKDTYPFHPKYIEVLQEIITRNRDLRRTRDAIRLTRKVVRRILRGTEDPSFIMPWHIDIRDPEIRNFVLTPSRIEFRDVASKDIVTEEGGLGAISECSKPALALKAATAILLKVYTYDTFNIPLKTFPTLRDAALMIYDYETFSSENLQPADIKTILDEMVSRLNHFNYQEERYWFDPYMPIIDLVERRANEILSGPRLPLYEGLKKHTEGLLVREPKRGGEIEERPALFSTKRTHIIAYGDYAPLTLEDKQEHYLIVFVKPRDAISEKDVEDLILRHYGGGLRTYKNTVAAVLPKREADFEKMLRYVAKIKAAEDVGRELRDIYHGNEEIIKIRQEKLKQYIQEVRNRLSSELLNALTCVAYPRMEGGRDVIGYVDTAVLNSIISQVEDALMSTRAGPKIRTRISFDDLTDFLNRLLGWDLVHGDRTFEFGRILEVFYTNTAAPFVRRDVVEEAVLEGLGRLNIGIKMAGEIYWKKVDGREPNVPSRLTNDSELLPLNIAAKEFADKILSMEKQFVEGGKLHRVWFEVEYMDQTFKLRDLIGQPNWVEVLKEGVVRRREEVVSRGFIIEVKPSYVEVDEGEGVNVKVSIGPVGGYNLQVSLKPDMGLIKPNVGVPPLDAEWSVSGLSAGEHAINIEVIGADGYARKETLHVNVRSLEEEVLTKKLDLSHVQAKLTEISTSDLAYAYMALSKASQIGMKAKVDLAIKIGDNLALSGSGVDAKISEMLIQKMSDIVRVIQNLKVEAAVSMKMDEPVILDGTKISALNVLAEKVLFKLRVRRK